MYFGLGSVLTKFFTFQFTEVYIAITIACFYTLSQYECGNSILPRLIPNCLCQWFLMSNVMLHLMLLQGNFLRVKPLVTVPRICWREQSSSAWWKDFMLLAVTAMSCCFLSRGLLSWFSSLLLSLSSLSCFYFDPNLQSGSELVRVGEEPLKRT